MDPHTTAIVLIEYQNDFTTEKGVFHDGVKGVMQSNNMLANTVEVTNKARAAGSKGGWRRHPARSISCRNCRGWWCGGAHVQDSHRR